MKRSLVITAVLPVLALTACGSEDKDKEAGATKAAAACGTLPVADATAKLPAGFPALGDQVLYEPSMQGSTSIVFGLLDETNFLEVRDELATKLKAAGYTVPGTDQESVEAELEFAGPHNGTVKVQPLCKGYVTLRYKVNG